MTAILGISAYFHDSAAALVIDGQVVAAAQEERFTRKKHDARFPSSALEYCLREAKLRPEQIDYVAFYDKPLLKFERLLESYLAYCPAGYRSFARAIPSWAQQKIRLPQQIRRGLGGAYKKRIVFARHHESHAASAFFPSPFEEAAIVTMDGVGEWTTSSLGVGRGNKLQLLCEQRFPHSLGLFYSAFTYFTGFKVNSGEYKLMGLAPYGRPIYKEQLLAHVIKVYEDGSVRLAMDCFSFAHALCMVTPRLDALLGGPPRLPEARITQRELDIAASVQAIADDVVLKVARFAHARTGQKNLCMAGGVALNCVSNGKLLAEGPFENIWVQPAAGDSGGALGAAQYVWYQLLDRERTAARPDAQRGSLLGPGFDDAQVRAAIERARGVYTHYADDATLSAAVAKLLAAGEIVGWFQGRMEFGPRALGSRSILGDPRRPEMQSVMNLKIKLRESFRPFAPAVLAHRVHEYFDVRPGFDGPYMLFVAPMRHEHRVASEPGSAESLTDWVNETRSQLPAITHVDYTARIQTVDAERHGCFFRLLESFEALTGCPVLVNTSFNVRGEPIVCTPDEALRCFRATNMDTLVLGRCVLRRADQPAVTDQEKLAFHSKLEAD